jgi:serine/threonine protein kinase
MWARRRWRPGERVTLRGRPYAHVRCLKADAFAENHLLQDPTDESLWVFKLSRPVVFLADRERRLYGRVAGIPGCAELGPVHGEGWFLHRFIPGRTLRDHIHACVEERRPLMDGLVPDFYERLERIVRAIHERGVIYMDLSKKANVIVTPEGEPVLIDFQISLDFPRRRGPLLERVFRFLEQADLYQVWKHRRRGDTRTRRNADPEIDRIGRERSRLHRFHRAFIRPVWLFVKRRIVPPEPA